MDDARERLDRTAARAAVKVDDRVRHRALRARLEHGEGQVDARPIGFAVVLGYFDRPQITVLPSTSVDGTALGGHASTVTG